MTKPGETFHPTSPATVLLEMGIYREKFHWFLVCICFFLFVHFEAVSPTVAHIAHAGCKCSTIPLPQPPKYWCTCHTWVVFVFPDNASPSQAPDVPVSCLSYLTSFSGYLGTKHLGAQLSKKQSNWPSMVP